MATLAPRFEDTRVSEDSRFRGPLFVLAILVGSFLLFLVQPMIARMALPRLGGAPAVWNSAMLVYQALLLGGYAYAHGLSRLAPRRQAAIHLGLLAVAALWLPIGLIASTPSAAAEPVLWVPWLLTLSIGPLFFVVAAQAPLMQRWYAEASGGRDPYALYAASNLGSFAGLIAYPLLVEPTLPLGQQSGVWTVGYVLLAMLVVGCATMLPRQGAAAARQAVDSEAPTLRRKLYWVALAFGPSGLMLSTTTYLTTDIVAMPLLWVLPLGLYLLSFTVAFATRRFAAETLTFVAPYAILILGGLTVRPIASAPFFSAGCGLALLFIVAVALHAEMYRTRPAPDRLTGFYLAMSIGGALGGVFAALVAPVLFDWTYEHPILIFLAGALVPQLFLFPALGHVWRNRTRAQLLTAAMLFLTFVIAMLAIRRPWQWLWEHGHEYGAAAIGLLAMLCIGRRVPYLIGLAGVLMVYGGWQSIELTLKGDARTRSYFGVYTVRDFPQSGLRTLAHGTTTHGTQIMDPRRLSEPTSYYGPRSGVGQAMIRLPEIAGEDARVGVVGLGTGTLACYARPGQDWRFFEIDPTVIDIARDSNKFSYLANCLPKVPIILGDARLTLSQQPDSSLDLLALDAFSSDAVPLHLLTKEAFETYGRVLDKSGLLLVHISNRFLDLEPVVAEAAREGRWTAALLADDVTEDDPNGAYRSSSVWVAMSRDPASIGRLINVDGPVSGAWRPLVSRKGFEGWSDDFASILPLIREFEAEPAQ